MNDLRAPSPLIRADQDAKTAKARAQHVGAPFSFNQQANTRLNTGFCYEDFSKLRWEDEGGAYIDWSNPVHRHDGMNALQTHLNNAENHLTDGEYDAAIDEFRHAADKFSDYKSLIETSFSDAITKLSIQGCEATPPHPKVLELIRLEKRIKAS